ncbi:MAG: phenylacetate--CoA ligase family protein, partial [Deltaproteobacteria bacterium]
MASYREHWNQEMETLSPQAYHRVQQEALSKQLDYVWAKSKFYQQKFQQAGVKREEIKSLEDLAKLPFTEKSELRESQIEAPPLGTHMACEREQVKRVYSTSGTTGRPTFIGLTSNDIMVWREAASRAFWTGGFRPDSSIPLVVAPFFIAASYADAIEHIGTLIPIGVGATDRLIGSFQHIGANAFLSTSSFPLHFAASLRKRGIEPTSLGIR